MRRRWIFGLFGALLLALLIVVACYPPDLSRPQPQRCIAAGLTSVPGFYISWSDATNAPPPTRATADPLYTAGSRQALGFDCYQPLDLAWPSAGTGNIDWANTIDACLEDAATITVTLGSGTVISQPVMLTIPPAFMTEDDARVWNGNYTKLIIPSWISNTTYITTFVNAGDTYN